MQKLKEAIDILRNGGIVIFPTDTAFGIGCRIDDGHAVERLFHVRRRSVHKATPVLVSGVNMAEKWVDDIPLKAREYMDTYWPGGLTLVLNSSMSNISTLVKGGSETLGVRMPDHPDILEIIKDVGVPVVGCSANFEGEKTPYVFEELDSELMNLADYVLPGECKTKHASTVVDCTTEPYTILREGAVNLVIG